MVDQRILQESPNHVLVALARDGHAEAWTMLYRRYLQELVGYLYHQLGDSQDAEDVAAETFMRVIHGLDGFDGRSSFRTWLYTIARNQLRDRWRQEGRRPRTVALDLLPPAVVPDGPRDHAPATNKRASALGAAVLERLPDHYRQVLVLRLMEGRSIKDTALAMATTPGNVKVMQHRALKRARNEAEAIEARTQSTVPQPLAGATP